MSILGAHQGSGLKYKKHKELKNHRPSRSIDGQARISAILPSPPLNLNCAKLALPWKPAEWVSSPTTEGPPGVETQTALCVPRAHCTTSMWSESRPAPPVTSACRGRTPPWWLSAGELHPVLWLLIPDQAPLYGGWFKKKKKKKRLFSFQCNVWCSEFGAAVRKPVHLWSQSFCCLARSAADIPHVPKVLASGSLDVSGHLWDWRPEGLHKSTALQCTKAFPKEGRLSSQTLVCVACSEPII